MDEDAKDESRVVGAFPNAQAAKTPKEKIEAFVKDLIESFKRAGDVPGSIAHYLSWLCKRLYGVIVVRIAFYSAISSRCVLRKRRERAGADGQGT